ncbi:MAG: aldehyde dehydrogenase family protein [Verrucomicrobia bacterium]|nr:aldehyde dehydrogenase family protein [Verrucomicrobiota bacterium]
MSIDPSSSSGQIYPLLLGGEWTSGESVQEVRAPYDGALIGRVWRASAAQTEEAVQRAQRGFQAFRRTPAHVRRGILLRCAALIEQRQPQLADLLSREAGKPVTISTLEVRRMKLTFELAAAELTRFGGELLPVDFDERAENCECVVRRFPVGIVAAIVPYNWPLNLAAHKIAPALAVGSTLLVKPATATPLSTLALGHVLIDAGTPPDALSILPCPALLAQKWVEDERVAMVSFTGSAAVGWRLKSIAGRKKVALELGGNAAVVVHQDADIDRAVQRIVLGGYGYAGQVCISVQRVFAHQAIFDRFQSQLAEAVRRCPYGDPLDPKTVCGPLIDSANAERVEAWIQEAVQAGARILAGGERKGNILSPTLLDCVNPSMRVCREEVFGPVVTLESYNEWEDALRRVNDSPYGLQAAVFTRDADRIHQAFCELEVGGVIANEFPTMRVDNFPYGGVKGSGFGREGVRYAMEEMTEPKVLFTRHFA